LLVPRTPGRAGPLAADVLGRSAVYQVDDVGRLFAESVVAADDVDELLG
jgi:hypothetical protein